MKSEESSSPLWEIIQSLSSSEKRYVKIHLQAKKAEQSALYIRLFDLTDKQETYDEAPIKKQLASKFSFSNFGVLKAALYETILSLLIDFHQENNVDLLLHNMLSAAEVLKHKSNVEATQKQLTKAAALALKFERFGVLMDVKQRQSMLVIESGNLNAVTAYYETESEHEMQIAEWLKEIAAAKKLSALTLMVAKKYGGLSDNAKAETLSQLIEQSRIAEEKTTQTFHARSYFLAAQGVIASLEKNREKALDTRLALHQLFTEHAHFIADKVQSFSGNLYNICVTYLTQENVSHCATYLQALIEATEKYKTNFTDTNRNVTQLRIYNLQLQLCAHKQAFDSVQQHIAAVEKIDRQSSDKKFEEFIMSSYIIAAMLFYLSNNFDASLEYVNKILNLREKEVRRDVILYARFLIMALHYKMDNHVLIEYELKNLRYFLSKNFTDLYLGKKFTEFFHLLVSNKEKLRKKKDDFLPLFAHAGAQPNIYERMFDELALSVLK